MATEANSRSGAYSVIVQLLSVVVLVAGGVIAGYYRGQIDTTRELAEQRERLSVAITRIEYLASRMDSSLERLNRIEAKVDELTRQVDRARTDGTNPIPRSGR